MVTFKAVVYKHSVPKGKAYGIRIRVTHQRSSRYIPAELYVTKEDLTKKMELKSQAFIEETNKIIKNYIEVINRYFDRISNMTVDEVVALLKDSKKGADFKLDFFTFGRDYVKQLQKKEEAIKMVGRGNSYTYTVALNSFESFIGGSIDINSITKNVLQKYIKFIQEKATESKREKGTRAPSLYCANLKALHNAAKNEYNDEDRGLILIPYSPFKNLQIPKYIVRKQRSLTIEQIRKIFNIEYRKDKGLYKQQYNRFNLAKDMFMLSFCLMGMNLVDLYNCDSFDGKTITYKRTKTKNRRKDQALISIDVHPFIKPIFEKYLDVSKDRVFNFYQHYSDVNTFTSNVNKLLKDIGSLIGEPELEHGAARHSWATIAVNDIGIDKVVVHEGLNHVMPELKITDVYVKKSFRRINEANFKIIDTVLQ